MPDPAISISAVAGQRPESSLLDGRYQLFDAIERGATGVVHRARHVALGRDVAIKLIHEHLAGCRSFMSALQREARAGARVDHPNVTRTIDFGCDASGRCYIAMELVEGESLRALLQRVPRPPETRVLSIVTQTLAALAAAHERGIVHRDVKPENVLLRPSIDDDGQAVDVVKLCDFGIASLSGMQLFDDHGRPFTLQGRVCGTPGYVAPEQRDGRDVDHRTDLYGVGAMLYEMLTGHTLGVPQSQLTCPMERPESLPAPSALCPSIDPRLEQITLRALHPDPEQRYQGARAMRADLLAWAQAQARSREASEMTLRVDLPDRELARLEHRLRPPRLRAALLGVAGLLLLLGAAKTWQQGPTVVIDSLTRGTLLVQDALGRSFETW